MTLANRVSAVVRLGAIAGAAGGLAEILWITLYCMLTGSDPTAVARSITAAIGAALPTTVLISAPVAFGIAVHLAASIALGIVLAYLWCSLSHRSQQQTGVYTFMLLAMSAVWLFNFFIMLPMISPNIVDLSQIFHDIIPYSASLASKILFGLSASLVFKHYTLLQPARISV
jgi:hypothetical protein